MMKKILVIEDDISVRESIEQILDAENFEVLLAENGRQGVVLAIEKIPDLIICDVMMPELDGYGVITELRSNSSTNSIPFIFLTAKSEKNDIRTGMNLGADDYLNKPFTISELLSAIAIRLYKSEAHEQKSEKKLEELRYNISMALPHELNTPLVGIIGYAEIIRDYFDEMEKSEIIEMVDHIHKAAIRQKSLVERILLYTHIQLLAANRDEFRKIKEFKTVFSKDYFNSSATKKISSTDKSVAFQLDLENAGLDINPEYLQIIIEELIDNCIKFSEQSAIVNIKGYSEEKKYILEFADNGRGISSEQIKKIGAFMQFDRKKFEQQGAGLGLILVSQITKLFDVELEIKSEIGKGTAVKIFIPLL